WGRAERAALAGDASFRRYHRLRRGGETALLMDAPPPQEDVRPFVAIDRILRDLGFSAPDILAGDDAAGLLLIEDFGDDTFTRLLAKGEDETKLYGLAVDVLIALHRRFKPGQAALPPYDDTRLLNEAALLVDWYLPAVTGRPTAPEVRETYLDLWRGLLPRARPARPRLARLSCRQSDAHRRPQRHRRVRPARFPGRCRGAHQLRSRLAARGFAARHRAGSHRGDARALSHRLSGARSRSLRHLLCPLGGPAPLQGHRHFHAPRPARPQAALPRAYSAAVALARP